MFFLACTPYSNGTKFSANEIRNDIHRNVDPISSKTFNINGW